MKNLKKNLISLFFRGFFNGKILQLFLPDKKNSLVIKQVELFIGNQND